MTLTFLDHVNDLPDIFQNSCLLFVDDLKTFSVVRNDGDARMLQNDVNNLTFWIDSWQLPLKVSKCIELHL